jgi:hypothetical protein
MKTHNSITHAPETLLFLAHVDANRREDRMVNFSKPLIASWELANAAAGTRLNFAGQPKSPIRRDRVH